MDEQKQHLIRKIRHQNTCPYIKNLSNHIINKIESGTTTTAIEIFETIVLWIYHLLTNQIPLSDLIQTHRVHPEYQSDTFWIKVFADRLRNLGFHVNDEVSFLVIDNSSRLLGDKLILPEEFDPKIHTLNYGFYIKTLGPNIDRLCLHTFPDISHELVFQKIRNHQPIYINEPVKFINKYYNYYHSLDELVPPFPLKEPEFD